MSKADDILRALFARAALMATQGPTLPVSFPEPAVEFLPPADKKYLDVQVFPNQPAWQGVSSGRQDQGLLQVSVIWPKNQGLVAPTAAAQKVIDHFAKGSAYFSGSTKVVVSAEPWRGPSLLAPDSVSIPVTIPWTA